MTKAALTILCLTVFLAAPVVRAQSSASDTAAAVAEEAARRQADMVTLQQELTKAQDAAKRNDLDQAAQLYGHCYTLSTGIGEPDSAISRQVVAERSAVLLQLARRDESRGNYEAAKQNIDLVLASDPHNETALAMQKQNDEKIQETAGMHPSVAVQEQIAAYGTNQVEVNTLIQDGKLLMEMGRYDDADAKLKKAIELEPGNLPAQNYRAQILTRRSMQADHRNDVSNDRALQEVGEAWNVPEKVRQLTPKPNAFNRMNPAVFTGKGRDVIMTKIDRIRVENVNYPDLSLKDVLEDLAKRIKDRDPEGKGINFYFDRQSAASQLAAAPAPDANGGLPGLPTDQGDVASVKVQVNLDDVRIADVLDAITKTADRPIKYSILDYAIVFSLRGAETVPMEIRTFHVDPNTFRDGLANVTATSFGGTGNGGGNNGGGNNSGGFGGNNSGGNNSGGFGGNSSGGNNSSGGAGSATVASVSVAGSSGGGNGQFGGGNGQFGGGGGGGTNIGQGGLQFVTTRATTDQIQQQVRQYFIAAGVDLSSNTGKVVFFNDKKGELVIQATAQDLDLIEAALQTLNTSPPQINIKTKFVEITQNDSRALGFQWYMGNLIFGPSQGIGLSGGTQPTFAGQPSTANPAGSFPGVNNGTTDTTIQPATSDSVITQGLRNQLNAPALATITGLLTEPQFRVVLNALEQRDGTDVLTAPEVTTESGRQAQMQAVDVQQIVTSSSFGTGGTGPATAAGGGTVVAGATATTSVPGTTTISLGPVLDVIAYVSADDYSIQMTMIPNVTEFLGYDNPGQFVPQASIPAGGTITAVLPLPHFRLRQVVTSVTVWDAQTVAIGGLMTDSISNTKDKVPMLGDLPLLGRFFRSESSLKTKKNLMIFVTPTIVNPDGTRYHADEEMPFAANLPVVVQKPTLP